MARELLRQGFRHVFIVAEGPDMAGAEDAMMKAGFEWYMGGYIMKFDREGKAIEKLP